MSTNQNKKKKQHNKYLQLTGISFQIGITIYLGAFFGKKLDAYYSFQKPWFTLLLIILAMAVSLYMVVKQLDEINKKDEE